MGAAKFRRFMGWPSAPLLPSGDLVFFQRRSKRLSAAAMCVKAFVRVWRSRNRRGKKKLGGLGHQEAPRPFGQTGGRAPGPSRKRAGKPSPRIGGTRRRYWRLSGGETSPLCPAFRPDSGPRLTKARPNSAGRGPAGGVLAGTSGTGRKRKTHEYWVPSEHRTPKANRRRKAGRSPG